MQQFYDIIETDTRFRKLPPEKFIHKACMYNFLRFSTNNKRKIWKCDQRAMEDAKLRFTQMYEVFCTYNFRFGNLFYL